MFKSSETAGTADHFLKNILQNKYISSYLHVITYHNYVETFLYFNIVQDAKYGHDPLLTCDPFFFFFPIVFWGFLFFCGGVSDSG